MGGLRSGVEAISNGYEVAWKSGSQYTVWYTDNSGNYASNAGVMPSNGSSLEGFETAFHQDLNGDGTIGPSAEAPLQSISLVEGHYVSSWSFGTTDERGLFVHAQETVPGQPDLLNLTNSNGAMLLIRIQCKLTRLPLTFCYLRNSADKRQV